MLPWSAHPCSEAMMDVSLEYMSTHRSDTRTAAALGHLELQAAPVAPPAASPMEHVGLCLIHRPLEIYGQAYGRWFRTPLVQRFWGWLNQVRAP